MDVNISVWQELEPARVVLYTQFIYTHPINTYRREYSIGSNDDDTRYSVIQHSIMLLQLC